MNVYVDIKGTGTVSGGGEYSPSEAVTLTAVPGDGWSFKYFIVSGDERRENPLSLVAENEDMTVEACFYVSIEDYLSGLVDFDIPEKALNSIRIDRNVKKGADVNDVDRQTLDLCYADILMWATTTPSTIQGAKESDNGWSHQDESKTLSINDKKRLEERALSIYRKYDDAKGDDVNIMKIVNLW